MLTAFDYITALDTLGAVKIDLRYDEVQVWIRDGNKVETFPNLKTAYYHYFDEDGNKKGL